jgi:hypothetical protein
MTRFECHTGCSYGPATNTTVVACCTVEIDEHSIGDFDKTFCIIRHDKHASFVEVST